MAAPWLNGSGHFIFWLQNIYTTRGQWLDKTPLRSTKDDGQQPRKHL